jgi:hypothetical protein
MQPQEFGDLDQSNFPRSYDKHRRGDVEISPPEKHSTEILVPRLLGSGTAALASVFNAVTRFRLIPVNPWQRSAIKNAPGANPGGPSTHSDDVTAGHHVD